MPPPRSPPVSAHVSTVTLPRPGLVLQWRGGFANRREQRAYLLRLVAHLEKQSEPEQWAIRFDVLEQRVWLELDTTHPAELARAVALLEETARRVT